jgi:hypothetical protein
MKTKLLLSAFFLFAVLVSNGQWTRDSLSEGTVRLAGATLGTWAYFAGGEVAVGSDWVDTDKVEIYDMETRTWLQIEYLTQARTLTAGVTCGDKVFFAGGFHNIPNPTSRVDIFYSGGLWLETELSVPRFGISAVSNDSLALFAGGGNAATNETYDVVDIYNINTNHWYIEHLSEPRFGMGSAVAGDLAFFAGGDSFGILYTNKVDIYHFSTGTWTTDTLSLARTGIGATTAQNKVIFAGGAIDGGALTDRVDIYDTETGTWDTASLSMARSFFGKQAVTVCGKAYFVGGSSFTADYDTIDIYDPASGTWEVMTMPNRLTWHTVVAIESDTSILIGGGWSNYTYPYGIARKNVEIYKDSTCIWDGNISVKNDKGVFNVFPNPSFGHMQFEMPEVNQKQSFEAIIYNMQGQMVFSQVLASSKREINFNLPTGIYLLRIITDEQTYSRLITIK